MPVVIGVALFGALGVLSRYGIDTFIERRSDAVFPWATFTVNVSGCLAVGFIIAALVDRHRAPAWLRTGLVMGFCGGFTTFSTFGLDTITLLRSGDSSLASLNVLVQVVGGLAGVYLAFALVEHFSIAAR